MDPSRLAAKQKRYKDILHFTETEIQDESLRSRLLSTLALYRSTLARYWKTPSSDVELETSIASLERTLAELHNEARLKTNHRCSL
jgi:hypothetical protein